jgi:hypothetical protein
MQTEAVVDALHQNAAQLGFSVQNDHIPATGIISGNCRCHAGRAAANDYDIMIYHLIYRSFL